MERKRRLKRLGWTVEEYELALERQGGRCAICGQKPKSRSLHADHDHRTGLPRKLLCNLCNRYIGCIERYDLWERLRAYLGR